MRAQRVLQGERGKRRELIKEGRLLSRPFIVAAIWKSPLLGGSTHCGNLRAEALQNFSIR